MRLRPYHPGEESKLWELYQGFSAEERSHAASDPRQWREQLAHNLPFVVEYGQQVIGYVNLGRDGVIDHFFVQQAWQGRGVGTLLMHKVHQQAAEQGNRSLSAYVCQQSVSFFSQWGFRVAPLVTHASSGNGVQMTKNLTA